MVCFRVNDRLRPFKRSLFVVIPDIDIDIGQVVLRQRRPDIIPEKYLFFLRCVNTGIPCLNGLWLILECQHRHVETAAAVLFDVSADVLRPAFPIAGL